MARGEITRRRDGGVDRGARVANSPTPGPAVAGPGAVGPLVVAPLPRGVDLRDRRYRALVEREPMIALAGDLALSRSWGCRWRKRLGERDLEGLAYAAQAGGSPGRLDCKLDRVASRAVLYPEANWRRAEALADALLRRREPTGRQVARILRGVGGRDS